MLHFLQRHNQHQWHPHGTAAPKIIKPKSPRNLSGMLSHNIPMVPYQIQVIFTNKSSMMSLSSLFPHGHPNGWSTMTGPSVQQLSNPTFIFQWGFCQTGTPTFIFKWWSLKNAHLKHASKHAVLWNNLVLWSNHSFCNLQWLILPKINLIILPTWVNQECPAIKQFAMLHLYWYGDKCTLGMNLWKHYTVCVHKCYCSQLTCQSRSCIHF